METLQLDPSGSTVSTDTITCRFSEYICKWKQDKQDKVEACKQIQMEALRVDNNYKEKEKKLKQNDCWRSETRSKHPKGSKERFLLEQNTIC